MRITINIQVNYDGATVGTEDDCNDLMHSVGKGLKRFIENGGLTPTGEEIVDDYCIDVEKG